MTNTASIRINAKVKKSYTQSVKGVRSILWGKKMEYKPLGEPLRSWDCKGCTNVCYRLINGEVHEYCRPVLEGRHKKEWVTDTFIDCLDKTTDPDATDAVIRIHEDLTK